VKKSPYFLRFFIKNGESEVRNTDSWGFFPKTPENPFKYTLQVIPRWITSKFFDESREFHLLEGVQTSATRVINATLQSDFLKGSRVAEFFPKAELAWLSRAVLDTAAISFLAGAFYASLPHLINFYVDGRIISQYRSWAEVIRYDYRYHYIKVNMQKGEVSPFDARKAAYLLNIAYSNYFDYMAKDFHKDSFQKVVERLHDHILFSRVVDLVEQGVQSTTEYVALQPGPLNENQKEELFRITHELYFGYQAVSDWIYAGAPDDLSHLNDTVQAILKSILARPFDQRVIALKKQGALSNLEMMYYLQLELSLRHFYEEKEILKIVFFRDGGSGVELNTDTLSELHGEILSNIQNGKDRP
jgi:hypothetical protein